jgi:septum site-determining protein MinD
MASWLWIRQYEHQRSISMGEAIVVTSGKGGVGKTTTTANIATGLALRGKKVVMVDADIGLRNLDVIMGLENRIVYDIIDVVDGVCRIKQALIRDKRFEGLYLLPAAQTKDKDAITPSQVEKLMGDLKETFDYVIIDCPAGIEQGFINAVSAADQAVVVTVPEVSAVRDADRVIGLLSTFDLTAPKLLVNRIRSDMVRRGDMMNIHDILEVLRVELVGVVPDDENIVPASNMGIPIVSNPEHPAGRAYQNVADRLMGKPTPFMDLEPQRLTLMSRFRRLFESSKTGGAVR